MPTSKIIIHFLLCYSCYIMSELKDKSVTKFLIVILAKKQGDLYAWQNQVWFEISNISYLEKVSNCTTCFHLANSFSYHISKLCSKFPSSWSLNIGYNCDPVWAIRKILEMVLEALSNHSSQVMVKESEISTVEIYFSKQLCLLKFPDKIKVM